MNVLLNSVNSIFTATMGENKQNLQRLSVHAGEDVAT